MWLAHESEPDTHWHWLGARGARTSCAIRRIEPTLSLERIVADAGEVVQYLRKRYAKDKVFVLGHSWGSVIGQSLAQRHPEW